MAKQCITKTTLIPLYSGFISYHSGKNKGLTKEQAFGLYVNLVRKLLSRFSKNHLDEHLVQEMIHEFSNGHLELGSFDFNFDITDDAFGIVVAFITSQPTFCEYFNGCSFEDYVEKFHPEDLELPF